MAYDAYGSASAEVLTLAAANPPAEVLLRCGCDGCMKALAEQQRTTGGDPGSTAIIGVAGDDIPDDDSTTFTLNVDEGTSITSSINHSLDQDWFVATLSSGATYQFTLTPTDGSGTGPDLMFEIYDQAGVLVASYDSNGMGAAETASFTPAADGAYYVAVKGYLPIDIGQYTLTAQIDDTPPAGGGGPLAAIDWGGVRVDTDDVVNEAGQQVIHVYFGKTGDIYGLPDDPVIAVTWEQFGKDAAFKAFEQYENVINVKFVEVATDAEADWVLCATPNAPVILGRMRPPGEPNEGVGEFNTLADSWSAEGLAQGGYGFITLIHEFGHGMGLAHPHDTGGGSEVMHGVEGDIATGYSTGDFGLNQGIYTTMSYNDGNPDGPNGTSGDNSYGYQGTMMALDVALLQQKYGANTTFHSGHDVYALPTVNAAGTFYSCIWDTGGTDWIIAGAGIDVTIDLRPATLQYEVGGGGFLSSATGIYGGFTIAGGVVIENAVGGAGTDTLIGNAAANLLYGGLDNDSLSGGAGDDTLLGEAGDDSLAGGDGSDTASYEGAAAAVTVRLATLTAQNTLGDGRDTLSGVESLTGSGFGDTLSGDDGANTLRGLAGNDRLDGMGGDDIVLGGLGADILIGGDGADSLTDTEGGADSFYGGLGNDILTVIHASAATKVVLDGGAGDDILRLDAAGGQTFGSGGDGNDRFELSAQASATGGAGQDVFYLADDYDTSAFVTIADFATGAGGDRFDLTDFLTDNLSGWNGSANPFASGFLKLATSAANVLLQVDLDGGANSWTTLFLIKNVTTAAFTAFNLGFAPPPAIVGTAGNDVLAGGAGADLIQGLAGDDSLKGNAGDDTLEGGDGNDLLYGLAGHDLMQGGAGADKLTGEAGNDTLEGGHGNDTLIGGLGVDSLHGGVGADIFLFTTLADSSLAASDLILDFAFGAGDQINVSAIDADAGLAGNQAFVFAAAFTNTAGQAVRSYDGGTGRTTVAFDVNGDSVADFAFQLTGDHTAGVAGWLL